MIADWLANGEVEREEEFQKSAVLISDKIKRCKLVRVVGRLHWDRCHAFEGAEACKHKI